MDWQELIHRREKNGVRRPKTWNFYVFESYRGGEEECA